MRRPWLCASALLLVTSATACTDDAAPATDGGLDAAVSGGGLDPEVLRCDPRRRRGDAGGAPDADPSCPLPNLVPVVERIQFQTRTFAPGSCEVQEGCTRAGRRRLLRFDLLTPNIGRGDLYLGPPVRDNRPDGRFEFGACHGHYHFLGYADYRLLDGQSREVGMGHKQSFCLLDSASYMAMGRSLPAAERYTCADQGIHAGWYDLYDRSLDCQYLDVTDVPPGEYSIRVRINERRGLAESNYDDNEARVSVTIPAEDPPSTDPTDACPEAVPGADRDCGWSIDRNIACTPGAMVTVGCNSACTPAVGSCDGDPVLRICNGDGPCSHRVAVAESNDACGTTCPSVTFACPFRGRFTVMTGAQLAGNAFECRVEARGAAMP